MDANTISVVQSSWKQVLPISSTAGKLFYRNLFEAAPSLRRLFKGDIDTQADKLVTMIDFAVGQLTSLDELVPALQSLGQRHFTYGVEPAHYDTVGQVLLKTLEQGLGPAFTPEVRDAWAEVYGTMASVMTTELRQAG
ncbi:MAG TPA: globin family protein [Burkholderiales bacterium]|nr:globin family protein [Burkholderiales bacterium]